MRGFIFYDRVFEPLQIRNTLIPHRIVGMEHGVGLHGEALTAYRGARAKCGVGMSIIDSRRVRHSNPHVTNAAYTDQVSCL